MFNIFKEFSNLSYKNAKFLSDKSYAYDTVFFVSKFIYKFQKNDVFNLEQNREIFNNYIIDIFNRNHDSTGTPNYYLEVINLLEYAGVIEEIQSKIYKILKPNIMLFINERMENAYIFNYLLTYNTFKNDGLLDLYKNICETSDASKKETLLIELNSKISAINISVKTPGTVWEKLNTKYALTVLNYANGQNYVSRELNIQNKIADIESISVNVKGTKTYDNLPKNNKYLKQFDLKYVKDFLKDYLFVSFESENVEIESEQIEAVKEMADLKLDLLELKNEIKGVKKFEEFSGDQYVENVVKIRNASAQKRFRNNLFTNTGSKCAICGLPVPELLTASHIKPYSKCEEIYDAVNYENGLLLCPIHDALFESANYITIESDSGKIKVKDKFESFRDFFELGGHEYIDSFLLTTERKHYLEWHNKKFNETNN